MHITKTYRYLLTISTDIEKLVNDHPSFALLLKDKIEAFYRDNQQQLDAASAMVTDLLEAYVVKDHKNNYLSITLNGKQSDWQFKDEHCKQRYHELYAEYIDKPVDIIL